MSLLTTVIAITLSACSETVERGQTSAVIYPTPVRQLSQTLKQSSAPTATPNSTEAERQNYQPISLSDILDAEARVGSDPKAIALSAFGNAESGDSQQVSVEYPQPNQAVVTIIQLGVADDSVRGIKYRVEFVPATSSQTGKLWEMVWAGSQVTCQPGRGHQDWSEELCL